MSYEISFRFSFQGKKPVVDKGNGRALVLTSGAASYSFLRHGETVKGTGYRHPLKKWMAGESGKQNKSLMPEIISDEMVSLDCFFYVTQSVC